MTTNDSDEKQKSELENPKMSNPSQRGGADSDMAASILFLVSPAGLFYNNQLLHPDGGNILVRLRPLLDVVCESQY